MAYLLQREVLNINLNEAAKGKSFLFSTMNMKINNMEILLFTFIMFKHFLSIQEINKP